MTGRALVLVGRGRYADPWHDDAATGHRIAVVLTEAGLTPEVRGTSPTVLDGVLQESRDGGLALLVVVAGTGRTDPAWDGDDDAWGPFHARLTGLVTDHGVPLLALHQSANTFTDTLAWAPLIGGRWVPGLSMHPPIGPAVFRPVAGEDHPVVDGLGPIEAFDERYCLLQPEPGSRVLVTTEHDGVHHPVVWQADGPGRVLYDGLGHDTRSYDSAGRRRLLRREVDWLVHGAG